VFVKEIFLDPILYTENLINNEPSHTPIKNANALDKVLAQIVNDVYNEKIKAL
jgi:hypothetical protein